MAGLTRVQKAQAVAIGDVLGWKIAADRTGLSKKTLQNFKKEVQDSSELTQIYDVTTKQLTAEWTAPVTAAIIVTADEIRSAVADPSSDLGRLGALVATIKTLGELQIAAAAVGLGTPEITLYGDDG